MRKLDDLQFFLECQPFVTDKILSVDVFEGKKRLKNSVFLFNLEDFFSMKCLQVQST